VSSLDFSSLRTAMVANQLRTNAITDRALLNALDSVAREDFTPEDRKSLAYIDVAIPLGHGRAMPAPLSTARLIQEARISAGQKVLLIGSGSAYAAALLDAMGAMTVMVEPDDVVAGEARSALSATKVEVVVSDWADGAAAQAPFDVLIIDGAVEYVPTALLEQLAEGAVVVAGIAEGGVTRVAMAQVKKGRAAFANVLDLEFPVLPGFSRAKGFSF
jgi:protein-L-isoaspartate(D-aspartate) O-methyltransferase